MFIAAAASPSHFTSLKWWLQSCRRRKGTASPYGNPFIYTLSFVLLHTLLLFVVCFHIYNYNLNIEMS